MKPETMALPIGQRRRRDWDRTGSYCDSARSNAASGVSQRDDGWRKLPKCRTRTRQVHSKSSCEGSTKAVLIDRCSKESIKQWTSTSCSIQGPQHGVQVPRRPESRANSPLDGFPVGRGVDIVVREICDYEIRRELTRVGATGSLTHQDRLLVTGGLIYVPITTDQM